MNDARDAHQERVHQAELEQVTKLVLLYADLVKLNPTYELIHDAQSWGVKKGIRLSNRKPERDLEDVTLYIEAHSARYSSYTIPTYYVRLKSSGYSQYEWKKNWTFATKDLTKKVHEKMTSFLNGIEADKVSRRTAESEAKRRGKLTVEEYPGQDHYSGASDSRYIAVTYKLDDEKHGSTITFEYAPDEKRGRLQKMYADVSKENLDKILVILKEDHLEQKERDTTEQESANA